jgi:hypothetical protein
MDSWLSSEQNFDSITGQVLHLGPANPKQPRIHDHLRRQCLPHADAQLQLFWAAAQPQLQSKKPRSPRGYCATHYQININFNIRLAPGLQRGRG